MYDIHSHVLPAVDDGARDPEESLAMARLAAGDGAQVMVMTPHHKDIVEKMDAGAVYSLVDDLNERLEAEGVPLQVVPGMECHLELELPDWARDGSALRINRGRYMLVELDFHQLAMYTDHVLYQLQLQGIIPVIAHAERQANIAADPSILEEMVHGGVLAQVTAGSLAGVFGPQTKKAAERLVQRRLVHCIASDTHRADGPRAPGLRAGFEEAARLVGKEEATALVLDTPRAIVEDRPVFPPPPEPERRRGLRSIWPLSRLTG